MVKIIPGRIALDDHVFTVLPLTGKRWFDVARLVTRQVPADDATTTLLGEMLIGPEHMTVQIDGEGPDIPLTEDLVRRILAPGVWRNLVDFAMRVNFPGLVPVQRPNMEAV